MTARRLVVVWREGPADLRADAEDVEVVAGYQLAVTRSACPFAISVNGAGNRAITPSNTVFWSRKSRYIGYENVPLLKVRPWNAPGPSSTTSRSGDFTGSSRSST